MSLEGWRAWVGCPGPPMRFLRPHRYPHAHPHPHANRRGRHRNRDRGRNRYRKTRAHDLPAGAARPVVFAPRAVLSTRTRTRTRPGFSRNVIRDSFTSTFTWPVRREAWRRHGPARETAMDAQGSTRHVTPSTSHANVDVDVSRPTIRTSAASLLLRFCVFAKASHPEQGRAAAAAQDLRLRPRTRCRFRYRSDTPPAAAMTTTTAKPRFFFFRGRRPLLLFFFFSSSSSLLLRFCGFAQKHASCFCVLTQKRTYPAQGRVAAAAQDKRWLKSITYLYR